MRQRERHSIHPASLLSIASAAHPPLDLSFRIHPSLQGSRLHRIRFLFSFVAVATIALFA